MVVFLKGFSHTSVDRTGGGKKLRNIWSWRLGAQEWVGFCGRAHHENKHVSSESHNKTGLCVCVCICVRLCVCRAWGWVKYLAQACFYCCGCVWEERRVRVRAAVAMVRAGQPAPRILQEWGSEGGREGAWGRWWRGSFKMPFSLTRQPLANPPTHHPLPASPSLHHLHSLCDSLTCFSVSGCFLFFCFPFFWFLSLTSLLITHSSMPHFTFTGKEEEEEEVLWVGGSSRGEIILRQVKVCHSSYFFFLPPPLSFCRSGRSLLRHLSSPIIFWTPPHFSISSTSCRPSSESLPVLFAG